MNDAPRLWLYDFLANLPDAPQEELKELDEVAFETKTTPRYGWRLNLLDLDCLAPMHQSDRLLQSEFTCTALERDFVHSPLLLGTILRQQVKAGKHFLDRAVSAIRNTGIEPVTIVHDWALKPETGCSGIETLFYNLALRKMKRASPECNELQAMIVLLAASASRNDGTNGPVEFIFLRGSLQRGLPVYLIAADFKPMEWLWQRDVAPGRLNLAYLVRIHDNRRSALDDADYQSSEAFWRAQTSAKHHAQHVFVVRVVGASVFVAQAFFGYYDLDSWLDFAKPLVVHPDLPAPALAGWRLTLGERPRFRGFLDKEQARQLFTSIDRLTVGDNVAEAYRDITGVTFERLGKRTVSVVRMNLAAVE